jgi:putative tricarboxylic transport membrane protein
MRLSRDGLGGLVVFAGSLVLIGMTLGLKDSPLVPVGPGFYPRIVLTICAVLGFAMFVNDWLDQRKAAPAAPPVSTLAGEGPGLNYKLVAIMFAVFAAYVFALPYVGFRIATFAYVAATNAMLSPPTKPVHWVRVLVLALATAFLTHLLFERYLSVLLPRGRWTAF